MAEDNIDVQLATRIPKRLHRELRLYCTENDTSLMQFVRDALRERLDEANKKVVSIKKKGAKGDATRTVARVRATSKPKLD